MLSGAIALVGCSLGCSSSTAAEAGCPGQSAGCPATASGSTVQEAETVGTAQLPPTGAEASYDAWLEKGEYKAWKCEPSPHDARSPSPHGKNRICSNAALAAHGAGEFPIGSAGVKELYDAAGTKIVGYATYRKVGTGKGEAWSWFEKTVTDGLIAKGPGTAGTPKSICVGCHAGTGSDAAHSGHDFVYTQVN